MAAQANRLKKKPVVVEVEEEEEEVESLGDLESEEDPLESEDDSSFLNNERLDTDEDRTGNLRVQSNSTLDIPNASIRRILRRAGVKRIRSDVYNYIRERMIGVIAILMHDVTCMTAHARRKTVSAKDVCAAMDARGTPLALGVDRDGNSSLFHTSSEVPPALTHSTKHRRKTGAAVAVELRYQKKHSDSFCLPRSAFRRLVRDKLPSEDKGISKTAMGMLQTIAEQDMIRFCTVSNYLTEHAHRQTLTPEDLIITAVVRSILL